MEHECEKKDMIEILKQKIAEIDTDFKNFRKVFYDLEKQYIATSTKLDNIFLVMMEMKKEIDERKNEPAKFISQVLITVVSSGICALVTYFVVRGGK